MKKFIVFLILIIPCIAMAEDPTLECLKQIQFDNELAPLQGKIGLQRVSDQGFEILTNTTYPTDEDSKAIAHWINKRNECMKLGEYLRSQSLPPALNALINANHADLVSLAADLHSGKLTFGEFAKLRMEHYTAFTRDWANATGQLQQHQDALAQQEEFRKQMILNQMRSQPPIVQPQQPQPNRPIYPLPMPTKTRCQRIGNEVVCTTY